NIFKHGNLTLASCPATLAISTTPTHLYFYSCNLPINSKVNNSESNKCGLKNISSRLESYYPDRHQFAYGTRDTMFVVELSITF
ncbi:MAG: hypothetical protein ACTHJ8_06585, partial [Mucilaginibacter sp.]